MNLVNGPFEGISEFFLPLLGFVATFTILFGNLAACAQSKLKRMLGLSGVAHAGYLLVAVMASMHFAGDGDRAVWVVFFYLFIYLFASFIVFGIMGLVSLSDDSDHEAEHYEGLLRKHPWAAICLLIGIGSLAGVPPLGGFIAKLMLFNVAFEAKLYVSLVAMVIGVVVSIYYYFGWIREICFEPKPHFDDDEKTGRPMDKDGGYRPAQMDGFAFRFYFTRILDYGRAPLVMPSRVAFYHFIIIKTTMPGWRNW